MMNFRSKFSLGLGCWALFAVGGLYATDVRSENIAVPFEFKVGRVSLPAGEYRVEQDFGKPMVSIVNIRTGRRVQMMRESNTVSGHAKLKFEKSGQGYKLRAIS